jgi:hypothetical protein
LFWLLLLERSFAYAFGYQCVVYGQSGGSIHRIAS